MHSILSFLFPCKILRDQPKADQCCEERQQNILVLKGTKHNQTLEDVQ